MRSALRIPQVVIQVIATWMQSQDSNDSTLFLYSLAATEDHRDWRSAAAGP
ncbi:hypothetical protein PHA47_28480 [Pseudomonas syringae pv. actinidiae]|nr:hypothetical protein [Pseudomonas syringae]WCE89614.1 hypothetical protein PHA47_28480 [Pseudomonas syringae pv. actinidiae]